MSYLHPTAGVDPRRAIDWSPTSPLDDILGDVIAHQTARIATRDLRRLDAPIRARVTTALQALAANPQASWEMSASI